jgi:hypothetical protein
MGSMVSTSCLGGFVLSELSRLGGGGRVLSDCLPVGFIGIGLSSRASTLRLANKAVGTTFAGKSIGAWNQTRR